MQFSSIPKSYFVALVLVVFLIGGLTMYFSVPGVVDGWQITTPGRAYVAEDEFIPVDFSVAFSSTAHEGTLVGNFWVILKSPGGEETHILPLFPREIQDTMLDNDMVGSVSFGNKASTRYNEPHSFTGYAYLSPLIHDGVYEMSLAIGRMEGANFDTPYILSKSSSRAFEVKRVFQTKKSLQVEALNTNTQPHTDGSVPGVRFRIKATEEDVMLRAFEIGTKHTPRPPRGVKSFALYDGETGEKLSDLTDLWTPALTIEAYTPFVLDTPITITKGTPQILELRAQVDPDVITKEDRIFSVPRIYGVNSVDQKIAEQVFLVGEILP